MNNFFLLLIMTSLFFLNSKISAQYQSIRTQGGMLNLMKNADPELSFDFKNYGSENDGVWEGEKGVVETVSQIMERDKLIQYTPGQIIFREEFESDRKYLPENPTYDVSSWPNTNLEYNPVSPILNPQTVGASFLGTQISDGPGYVPPDCMGDVGPTQVMVAANGRIKVFDKSGSLGPLNADMDNFFNSVRNGTSTTDPHIRYDRLSQRWFVTIINVASTNNRVLIAVSSGPTISSLSSFTFFYFQHNTVSPAGDAGEFADYPTLGVDVSALYIGVNNFLGNSFNSCTGFVVRKSSLLGAGSIIATAFRDLCNTSTTGPYTPQGVDNDDPSATQGYFIGVDAFAYSLVVLRRVSDPGGTPTISGNLNVVVPTTYYPLSVPALGTSTSLDALDDRLFAAQIRKNKISGNSSLWTAHNIRVNSSGVGGGTGTFNRDACRWYEISNLSTTPSLNQSGTLFDGAASNPQFFWIPSVAMSGQGHMSLGSSRAGTGRRAEIVVAGRLSSDVLGTTQSFSLAQSSTTAYNVTVTNPQRWGDYSQTVIDPNDDMTIWTFQEYCNAANSWGVRAIQLIAPPPATPSACVPGQVESQQTVNVVVNGTSTNGSGFFDPGADVGGPGFLNRISASIPNVTVNSVTYNSPTQVTLNLTIGAVTVGLYNVTITNPDGQSATGIGILQIDSPVPVELTSFSATTIGSTVKLSWNTATEVNNYGFEIERKVGSGQSSVGNYEKIGFVNGNGNSNSPKCYSYEDKGITAGKYSYRLKQIDNDGQFEYSKMIDVDLDSPKKFELSQNYPNPFNPTTTIRFGIPEASMVKLTLFNILGQEVRTLVNEFKESGAYTINFSAIGGSASGGDASDLNSGMYIYKIEAGSFTQTRKMTLIK